MDSLVADPVLARFMSCTVPRESKGNAYALEEQCFHLPPSTSSSDEDKIPQKRIDDVRRKRQRIDQQKTHMSPFVSYQTTPRVGRFVSHDDDMISEF